MIIYPCNLLPSQDIEHSHHPAKFGKSSSTFGYGSVLQILIWFSCLRVCESALHVVRVLPELQSSISELDPFADDMLCELEKVCLLFLYELSCGFFSSNVSLPTSKCYWQYISWFSTTVSQSHKKGY